MTGDMLTTFSRFSLLIPGSLALVLVSGCASAPRVTTPPLTYEQKLSWILRLEDQRVLRDPAPPEPPAPATRGRRTAPVPAPPIADLIPLLADSEARVRRRAALAVGRVGLQDGVAPLAGLLTDGDPEVRQMAAFALGLVGHMSAAAPLQAALQDTSYLVRGRAAEALGLLGATAAAPAIGAMTQDAARMGNVAAIAPDEERWPMDPAVEAFRLGLFALVRLQAYDALASASLNQQEEPVTRWWPVAYALQRVADPRAVPALTRLVQGEGRYTVAFAARGLGEQKAARAVEPIAALLQPGRLDPLVAVSALRALAQIGGPEAGLAVLALLRAPELDPNVRLEAVIAAGGLRLPEAADPLMDHAADRWPAMRAQALTALASADRESFLFALSGLDADRHWSVRAAIGGALAGLDPEVAVPRLEAMLDDGDRRAVPAALSALARLKPPSLEEILRRHLGDPDVVIRLTAARALGELGPADGPQLFADAYRRWSGDPTYLARAAALTSVARYGPAAEETLREALADREWAVRVHALSLLQGMEAPVDPHVIRPAPGQPPLPYDAPEVVAPQFSPHVYIETTKGLIEIELAVTDAPVTAQTIMALARRGFFTGVPFHRVVPNFVVQGGDPRGDGEGGPGFTVRDEINQLPYLRGTVGMALDWRDTGGSQFFITHSPQPHLDARYTVIGRVIRGMEVVDRLQQWDVIERVRVWDGVTLGANTK
jgi:cyclophilin family peptidyl-prolyl cis-trans isomerase/HEAT repeat protein